MTDLKKKRSKPLKRVEPFGRPRTYDRKKEGDELVEWANTDEAIVLRKFFGMRGYTQEVAIVWTRNDDYFKQCYDIARLIIGARRESMTAMGTMNHGVYNRYASLYDRVLRDEERDEKTFEANLKNQEGTLPDVHVHIHDKYPTVTAENTSSS